MCYSERYIKDNRVAVIYTPSFGVGWSTSNMSCGVDVVERSMFDPELVKLVLERVNCMLTFDEERENFIIYQIKKYAQETFGSNFIDAAADSLKVNWLDVGTIFEITEYDGWESIKILDMDYKWFKA